MILGLGEDIVSITRITKLVDQNEERFLQRCYSPAEIEKQATIANKEKRIAWLAKRFAAKEACAKALGTGIRNGMNFYDIETLSDPNGRPVMSVTGKTLERLQDITPKAMMARLFVTLSDEPPIAKATVLIEAI
jgi:holo-[acyl-carrier protein] synthase